VANVEFDDLRQARDRLHRVVGEAVTRVDLKPSRMGIFGTDLQSGQFVRNPRDIVFKRTLAVGTRMQFDDIGAKFRGRLDGP